MAYKPPIHRGRPVTQSVSRQALVQALAARLAQLLGDEPILPPEPPFRGSPAIPPRPPFRTQPAIPPRGPFRGEPVLPPQVPVREEPYLPPQYGGRTRGWVPPSAWDWVRQPGFYDEEMLPGDRF